MDREAEKETERHRGKGALGRGLQVRRSWAEEGRTTVPAQHHSGASSISLHPTDSGLPQHPAPLPPRVGASLSYPCLALVDLGWYQRCNRALGPKIKGFPSLLLGLQSLWGMEATWGVYVPWTLGPQALPALSSGPALWH